MKSSEPTSQRQVQDHVVALFQRTVDAFPRGTALDTSRYGTGSTTTCDDNATDPDAPVNFAQYSDMRLLPGTDSKAAVAKLGDTWVSWGWKVIERDDFPKPNRFADAPDGYSLQAWLSGPADSLGVVGESPCYNGRLVDYTIRVPTVIESRGNAPR